jgi:hypothetical protein
MTPEQKARVSIDALLVQAGWHVCNVTDANIHAGDGAVKGVANREVETAADVNLKRAQALRPATLAKAVCVGRGQI